MTALTIAAVMSGLSVLLLAVVTAIWFQNYRHFRTPLALGLLVFCVVLLLENLVAVYFYVTTEGLFVYDPTMENLILLMRVLQFVAIAVFAYVSWRE